MRRLPGFLFLLSGLLVLTFSCENPEDEQPQIKEQEAEAPVIKLRSESTFPDGKPLFIVVTDGVISNVKFEDLDPNDIENISIYKGATASALYGTAGANGVVLITTKKGTSTKSGG